MMFLRSLRARGACIVLLAVPVAAIVAVLTAAVHPLVAQPSTPPSTSGPPGFERLRKIDVHSHIYEDMPVVTAMLRRINLRVVNISNPGTDGHLDFMHRFNAALVKRHPDIFSFASTFDLTTRNQPDYGARVAKALDETFAQGAVMVKIWKEVGLELKRPDGAFLLPDDPILDPVYAHWRHAGNRCWRIWRSRARRGCRWTRRACITATTRATRSGICMGSRSTRATRS